MKGCLNGFDLAVKNHPGYTNVVLNLSLGTCYNIIVYDLYTEEGDGQRKDQNDGKE
jgi:hypothetical protein